MQHIFSVLVFNQPGVLARIAGLCAARNFNIHSLAVGTTLDPDISRITFVINADNLDQFVWQLKKSPVVINVAHVDSNHVARGFALVKVKVDGNHGELLSLAGTFRARVVDANPFSFIFEITGSDEKLNAFVELVKPFGIVEIIRSGLIALDRGSNSIYNSKEERNFYGKNLL